MTSIKQALDELLADYQSSIRIRIDEETQMASVIDPIRIVMDQKSGHASLILRNNTFKDECVHLRINGKVN